MSADPPNRNQTAANDGDIGGAVQHRQFSHGVSNLNLDSSIQCAGLIRSSTYSQITPGREPHDRVKALGMTRSDHQQKIWKFSAQ